jgi:hypothetical protein
VSPTRRTLETEGDSAEIYFDAPPRTLVLGLSLVTLLSCGLTLCRNVREGFLASSTSGSEKHRESVHVRPRSSNATYAVELVVWSISLCLSIARLAVIPSAAVRSVLEHWPHRLIVAARVVVLCAVVSCSTKTLLDSQLNSFPTLVLVAADLTADDTRAASSQSPSTHTITAFVLVPPHWASVLFKDDV